MHENLKNDMILARPEDADLWERMEPWDLDTAIAHQNAIQLGMRVDCVNMFGNQLGTVKELEKGSVIVSLDSGVTARLSCWDIYPINTQLPIQAKD